MSKIDIVNTLLNYVEQDKFQEASSYLAEDFTFVGPAPKPLNKNEWFGMHKKFNEGIPDFKFNIQNLNESGNVVNGTVQLTGTQTNDLPSLMPGIPIVPATYKKIQLPKENVTVTFKNDKVVNITVERVPTGGVVGLLKQLGVTLPEKI